MGHRGSGTFSRSQAESVSPAPRLGVLHCPGKGEEEWRRLHPHWEDHVLILVQYREGL